MTERKSKQRSIKEQADSEAEAIEKAAKDLQCEPDNLRAEKLEDNNWLVSLINDDVQFEIVLSDDKCIAHIADFLPAIGDGAKASIEMIEEHIKAAGIVVDVDPDGANEFIDAASEDKPVDQIIIARGTQAVDGTDAHMVLNVETLFNVGQEREDGSIDFTERHLVNSVAEGQLIGTLIDPTMGVDGTDLLGEKIPSVDGVEISITTGDNTRASEDQKEFFATGDGMLSYANNTISVNPILTLPGNVDLSTGNVHMDNGSVVVPGVVTTGFEVDAKFNIVVNDAVEKAKLVAGEDVEVNGGILCSQIESKGSVSARFAEGAEIHAEGDVTIANGISSCIIECNGSFLTDSQKGIIRGGSVHVGSNIQAKDIGSSSEVATEIIIGTSKRLIRELTKQRKEISEGENSWDEEIAKIRAQIQKEQRSIEHGNHGIIKVFGTLYPGVKIEIFGNEFELEEPLSKVKLSYCTYKEQVICQSL